MATFLNTLVGLVVGGVITFFVSRHYYQKASSDLEDEAAALRKETARLQRHTTMILRGLEEPGPVELNRDKETGEIVGIVIKLSGSASGGSSASGTLTAGEDADIDAPADQD